MFLNQNLIHEKLKQTKFSIKIYPNDKNIKISK
jgi:hypothetical protein